MVRAMSVYQHLHGPNSRERIDLQSIYIQNALMFMVKAPLYLDIVQIHVVIVNMIH